ncbi:AAA family ATPase [Labilithrix luteola]|nr:AAA family ATPase [Labilithrix luteola]
MANPPVSTLIFEHAQVGGWPKHQDARGNLFPIARTLTEDYDTDAHFVSYSADIVHRHTHASITEHADEANIQMQLAVFDVDGPGHVGTDEWFEAEMEKANDLILDGAFIYRTRGGYRIVGRLPRPFYILDADEAASWSELYLAWCNYLQRVYGIVADRKCKDWQHLFRAPRAMRDGVVLDLPTTENADDIGLWQPALTGADWQAEQIRKVEQALTAPREETIPVSGTRLERAAAILANAWPAKGEGRDGTQLALAGVLWHLGWDQDAAVDFVCDVCRLVGDEDRPKRTRTVQKTWLKAESGGLVGSWANLASCVGHEAVDAARALLTGFDEKGFAQFQALLNAPKEPPPTSILDQMLAEKRAEEAADSSDDRVLDKLGIRWGGWNKPIPPPSYLLEGLIPEGKVVAFFAEGGSVKTWSALSLAISVATGKPWLEMYPVKQGRAIYLDYEDGMQETQRRVNHLEIVTAMSGMMEGQDIPDLGYRYGGQRLDNVEFWAELTEHVKEQGITLLVFDSVSAAMPGGLDENASQFSEGIKHAGTFTELTGCTVVFIHHANKGGGMRGHSSMRDQCDIVFRFEPVSESENGVKRMRMVCDKPGPQKKPAPVNVELTKDARLVAFSEDEAKPARDPLKEGDTKQAIRLVLATGPMANVTAIREAVGRNRKLVNDTLMEMSEDGEIVKLGKTGGYALNGEEHQTQRVLDVLASDLVFVTASELARQAYVDTTFVERLRLRGVVCQSGEGRWMGVKKAL